MEHRLWAVDGSEFLTHAFASRVDGATTGGSVRSLGSGVNAASSSIYCSTTSIFVMHTIPSNRITVFRPSGVDSTDLTFGKQVQPVYLSAGDATLTPRFGAALNTVDRLLAFDSYNLAILVIDRDGSLQNTLWTLRTNEGQPIQPGRMFVSPNDKFLVMAPETNGTAIYAMYGATGIHLAYTNFTVCDVKSLMSTSTLDVGSSFVQGVFYVLGWNTTGATNTSHIMTVSMSTSATCSIKGVFTLPHFITRIVAAPSGRYLYGTTCDGLGLCSASTVGRFCKFDLDTVTGEVKGTYSCTAFTATTVDANVAIGGVTGNAGSNLIISPGGTKLYMAGPTRFLSVLIDEESSSTLKGLTVNNNVVTATSNAISIPFQSFHRQTGSCRIATSGATTTNITTRADVYPYLGYRQMTLRGVTEPWSVYNYASTPSMSYADPYTSVANMLNLNMTLGMGTPIGITQGIYELYYEENNRKSFVAPLLIEDYGDLPAVSGLSLTWYRGNVSVSFASSGTSYSMASMDVTTDGRLLLHSDGFSLSVQCYIRSATTGLLTYASTFPIDASITKVVYWPETSTFIGNSASFIYAFRYDSNLPGCGLIALAPRNLGLETMPHTAIPQSLHYTAPWTSTTYRAVIYVCWVDNQEKLCELPWVAGNLGTGVTFTNITSVASGTRVSVWYNASGNNMVETILFKNGTSKDGLLMRTRNSAEQANSAKPFSTIDVFFPTNLSSVTSKSLRTINGVSYLHHDIVTGLSSFLILPSGSRTQNVQVLAPGANRPCLSSYLARDRQSVYLGCLNLIMKFRVSPITGTICADSYQTYAVVGNVTSFSESADQAHLNVLITNQVTSSSYISVFEHDYPDAGINIVTPLSGTYTNGFTINVSIPDDSLVSGCQAFGTAPYCGLFATLTSLSENAFYFVTLTLSPVTRGVYYTAYVNATYPTDNTNATGSIQNGSYTLTVFYFDRGGVRIEKARQNVYLNVECPPGFYGTTCGETAAVCATNRCSGSGSCTTKLTPWIADRTLRFGCNCVAGIYGRACDLSQALCDTSECNSLQSGGACIRSGCSCPGNWDPTSSCYSCINHFDPNTDCTACLAGYFGTYCNQTAAVCSSQRCNNHGECSGAGCSCTGPFGGVACNTHICGSHGVPATNNLSCTCDVGYLYGVDPVLGNNRCYSLCSGKGTWDVFVGKCVCQNHYGGDTCSRYLDNTANAESRVTGNDVIILSSVLGAVGLIVVGMLIHHICAWRKRNYSSL